MTILCELISTDIARIWFLAGVASEMPLQVATLDETFATGIAL